MRLFNQHSIFDIQKNQQGKVRKTVLSLEQNYLLNASEEDLANWVVEGASVDVPELNEAGIHVEHNEKQIDVSGDPNRLFFDHHGPFYVTGSELTFVVPFNGDPEALNISPTRGIHSSSGSRAEVVGNDLHFTYQGENLNAASAKASFNNELQLLKQNLESLKRDCEQFKNQLHQEALQLIRERKNKVLASAKMVADLGFPISKRSGAPTSYAVPVQKRKPKIERPPAASQAFQPEPALAPDEYENILGIMRSMVRVMEQSPKAFENMGEEDLRTHFLVQLNAQYEGRATGETFNYQGKTDILIRADEGGNVFIAECKFWAGEKQFLETIDQLLSYLTWRDTKTAVLIFNRNVNFSDVLKKIAETAPKHNCYKRTAPGADETTFRYVFHSPNDVNRELLLTVMAFDIPKGTR